jgi:hypothetical protein
MAAKRVSQKKHGKTQKVKKMAKPGKKSFSAKRSLRKRGGAGMLSSFIGTAKQEETAAKSLIQQSKESTAATAAATATIATAATIATKGAYAAVATLSASGVGLPLAGAIAGALLIANKLANLYITNKKLYPIMLDAMNILVNCYRMNDLFEKVYGIMLIYIYNQDGWKNGEFLEADYAALLQTALSKREEVLTKKVGGAWNLEFQTNIVGKIRMDDEIRDQIHTKIEELTSLLLQTATDPLLKQLQTDADINKSGFGKVVQAEMDRRAKVESSIVKRTVAKLDRGINRAFYASDIKDDITDNLTLINGYLMIMKSQYDEMLTLYEREFGDDWKIIWKLIEQSDEFTDYMVPKNLREATTEVLAEEQVAITEAAAEMAKEVSEAPDAAADAAKPDAESSPPGQPALN